jgi:hypothetical protein
MLNYYDALGKVLLKVFKDGVNKISIAFQFIQEAKLLKSNLILNYDQNFVIYICPQDG